MRTLLVDNGSFFLDNLRQLLGTYPDNEVTVVNYSVIPGREKNNYDLIILSGGHHKVIDHADDLYKEEINLILTGRTPILGICLGCELIAYAYGSHLDFIGHKEEGLIEISIVNDDPIFKNIRDPIPVYESHKYSISELPKEISQLAKSKDGPEIIKHISKPIYGFQFHPEVDSRNSDTLRLFLNTVNQLTQIQH